VVKCCLLTLTAIVATWLGYVATFFDAPGGLAVAMLVNVACLLLLSATHQRSYRRLCGACHEHLQGSKTIDRTMGVDREHTATRTHTQTHTTTSRPRGASDDTAPPLVGGLTRMASLSGSPEPPTAA